MRLDGDVGHVADWSGVFTHVVVTTGEGERISCFFSDEEVVDQLRVLALGDPIVVVGQIGASSGEFIVLNDCELIEGS